VKQLDFDGEEHDTRSVPRPTPLNAVQREILRYIGEHGSIRSVQAGEIVHAARQHQYSDGHQYWSADGLEAMKRLLARGLVKRDPDKRGRWLIA